MWPPHTATLAAACLSDPVPGYCLAQGAVRPWLTHRSAQVWTVLPGVDASLAAHCVLSEPCPRRWAQAPPAGAGWREGRGRAAPASHLHRHPSAPPSAPAVVPRAPCPFPASRSARSSERPPLRPRTAASPATPRSFSRPRPALPPRLRPCSPLWKVPWLRRGAPGRFPGSSVLMGPWGLRGNPVLTGHGGCGCGRRGEAAAHPSPLGPQPSRAHPAPRALSPAQRAVSSSALVPAPPPGGTGGHSLVALRWERGAEAGRCSGGWSSRGCGFSG